MQDYKIFYICNPKIKAASLFYFPGEMAEWSNAVVLKTIEGHTSGGSNPSLSARRSQEIPETVFYFVSMNKKTLVLGASPNPNRYSYQAVERLVQSGHSVYAFGLRIGEIASVNVNSEWPSENFDTITLYLNPQRQSAYTDRILELKPKRVIFNPGTENPAFMYELTEAGVDVEVACALVMLSVGNY